MIAAVLARARGFNPEQRKLALSLGVNFVTRVPGAFGLLLILPLLRFDLGTVNYAFLLGALALGSTTTFLFGGFNTMGRRLIGEAFSHGDHQGEADGFMGLVAVSSVIALAALVLIGGYTFTQPRSLSLFIIAGFVVATSYFNVLDNVRTAYNEHYVTAVLQIVFQVTNFALAFAFRSLRVDPLIACYIIQGHGLLASLVAGGFMLRHRPHLLRGSLRQARHILRSGMAIGMADGLLAAMLSLSVVWIQASSTTQLAGWYATLMRLFQTILVPVILLLMPLSSYIRLIWHKKDHRQQRRVILATVVLGLGYGALASGSLSIASVYYIERLLKLPSPGHWAQLLAIYMLFTAIIGYRAYSTIAYLVMDGARLATQITTGLVVALGVAALASRFVSPFAVIAIFAGLVSVMLVATELLSAARFKGEAPSGI